MENRAALGIARRTASAGNSSARFSVANQSWSATRTPWTVALCEESEDLILAEDARTAKVRWSESWIRRTEIFRKKIKIFIKKNKSTAATGEMMKKQPQLSFDSNEIAEQNWKQEPNRVKSSRITKLTRRRIQTTVRTRNQNNLF